MRSISPWRRTFAAAAAAVVALSLSGPPASARTTTDQPTGGSAAVSNTKAAVSTEAWAAGRAKFGAKATAAQAVTAYWTPARMRAAQPIEETAAYQDAVRKYANSKKTAQPDQGAPQKIEPAPGRLGQPGPAPAAWDPGYPPEHPTART